jgi:hypothetical protein
VKPITNQAFNYIMDILKEIKSVEEVTEELLHTYRINYCIRYVREHIKELLRINLVKRVVVLTDGRKKYYVRSEIDQNSIF